MQRTQDSKSDPTLEGVVPEPRPRSPWRVVSVRALPEWRLAVKFMDGTEGEVDMALFIRSRKVLGTVFEPLRNPVFFSKAHVELGVVTWPNGTDLAPDTMHDEIKAHGRYVMK